MAAAAVSAQPLQLRNELDKSRSPYVSVAEIRAVYPYELFDLIEPLNRYAGTCIIQSHGRTGRQKQFP